MICKNCGKEVKENDLFCIECGTKIENTAVNSPMTTPLQTTIKTANSTVAVKKKYPGKLVIICIAFVFFIIFLAIIGSSDVIESNSESGASFIYTMEEVIERYNDNIDEVVVNDSGLSENEFEEVKEQIKLKESYFRKESDNKYFASNDTYGITIQVDDDGNVYFIGMVWGNNLSDDLSTIIIHLLRGLIVSVQPSLDSDDAKQIIIDTDNTSGILQKDDVKYMVTYENDCTRFSFIAMFDE